MRIITWNIRKAKSTSPVWKILNDLNPDIILLQEVLDIPQEFSSQYSIESRKAINKKGKPQIFGTAILVKGEIILRINLSSEFHWVNQELDLFNGNIIGYSHSFDKGFFSKDNLQALQQSGIPEVIMPKKGNLNKEGKQRESSKQFKKLRYAHSAIENNINMLEHQ
jgi:exonuclease III